MRKLGRGAAAFGILILVIILVAVIRRPRDTAIDPRGASAVTGSRALTGPFPERAVLRNTPTCPQCRVELTKVATLGDSSDLEIPGASSQVHRSRGGQYFVTSAQRDKILVYDSAGRFLQTLGKYGQGPGEFNAAMAVTTGPGDTVYVIDAAQGISAFSPQLKFLERSSLSFAVSPYRSLPLDSGRILVNANIRSADQVGHPFHLMSASGGLERSFGAVPNQAVRPDFNPDLVRLIVPGPDARSFWDIGIWRYEISLVSTDGARTARIVADLPWAPTADSLPAPPYYLERPKPILVSLARDSAGLLYVFTRVADEKWAPDLRLRAQRGSDLSNRRDRSRFFDTVVDVIDPSTGELISTQRNPEVLNGWGASTDGTYLFSRWEDEFGMIKIDIWRARLRRPG